MDGKGEEAMSLTEKIKQKAKTPLEVERYVKEWRETFRSGAMGNHRAYAEARDTRHFIEEDRWIPEKDVLAELTNYKIIPVGKWQEIVEAVDNRPSWEWMKDNLDKLEEIEFSFRKIEAKVAELKEVEN